MDLELALRVLPIATLLISLFQRVPLFQVRRLTSTIARVIRGI